MASDDLRALIAATDEELRRELDALQARVDKFEQRAERLALAWSSARRRAAGRRLNGERAVGGPIRQALIDAGIITATDRVADAVEKIRALGPQPACKHGVLPEQGLCLYCAAERNLPTTEEESPS